MTVAGGNASCSLDRFECPGWYEDDAGREEITWTVLPSTRRTPPGQSGSELHTVIRGVEYWGYDVDGITDDSDAELDPRGNRTLLIAGELPCTIEEAGVRSKALVSFVLDLKARLEENWIALRLELAHGGHRYEARGEVFEDGMARLAEAAKPSLALICCYTCSFSDYSPFGHGTLGMDCHRGAKEQYLAVRSKKDYWHVPRTEEVMETHVCAEYQKRMPGTGYRG